MKDIEKELQRLLEEVCGVDKSTVRFTDEADLIEDLGLDSLGVMELLDAIENTFGICFDDVDLLAENFTCMKDLVALIYETRKMVDKRNDD